MRNLANFHQSTQNSQNWDFGGILLSKVEIYELKIYRGVVCHDNEDWCKIGRVTDLSFQNWHKEFDEFWPEHSKVSKVVLQWSKYIMFEPKKVQRSYVWWHWRLAQNLKGNWLALSKMGA